MLVKLKQNCNMTCDYTKTQNAETNQYKVNVLSKQALH